MNYNNAIVIGRLTREPELKKLPNGNSVASFSIATNKAWTGKDGEKKEQVTFHNIVVFGKTAESCARYLKKGQIAMVEGSMNTRSWDKEDGTKGYRFEVIANRVQFGPAAGAKKAPGAPTETPDVEYDKTTDAKPPAPEQEAQAPSEDKGEKPGKEKVVINGGIEYPEEEINPDDIPF